MTGPLERLKTALADRYTIEHEIGRGGTAIVYLAEDLKLHRQVAIKVLRPELCASLGTDRFLQEIELTAKLQHPQILPLHEAGETDGFLYYVMPFVEGESLRDRMDREGKLSVEEATRITDDVATALSYAHARGVVHRDIKPENIMLTGGRAVVADFGIARAFAVAGGERLTATGLAVGTPAYMSPEQAVGEENLDGRSDVYSLGCVVYEMVDGRAPFQGATAQALLAKHAAEEAPSLRTSDPAIPLFVERAVERSLAKDPDDRFQSASEFTEALTTGTVVARVRGRSRRRFVGIAAVAVLAGAAVALWQPWRGTGADVFLDPNVALVLPFQGAGGGQAVEDLREDLVYLFETRLTGEGTPRAVVASAALVAWDDLDRTDESLPTLEEALELARSLGAGQLWWGSVIATGQQVELSATVMRTSDGEQLGQAPARGHIDSVLQLADEVALQLLPQQAGERRSLRELTTGSLPALRAYLEGRRFYAVGEWDAAATAFDRALEYDSLFALAAFYQAFASAWSQYRHPGPASAACRLLDRLGRREQLLLPCDPEESPPDRLARLEQAATLAPDWVEAWYSLGDVLFHSGATLGVPKALDSAAACFDRTIALADSARRQAMARGQDGGALGDGMAFFHRAEMAGMAGDAATLERLTDLQRGIVQTAGAIESRDTVAVWMLFYLEWMHAWAVGDTARGQTLTSQVAATAPGYGRDAYLRHVIATSQLSDMVPMRVIAQLVDSLDPTGGPAFASRYRFAHNRGGPREAVAVATRAREEIPVAYTSIRLPVMAGIVGEGDSADAAVAVLLMEDMAWQDLEDRSLGSRYWLCLAQTWRLQQGDYSTLARVEQLVFDSVGLVDIANYAMDRTCARMLTALAAHKLSRPTAARELARLDSTLHTRWGGRTSALLSASIHLEQDDPQGALVALRRRSPDESTYEATFLRLEGDLAWQLGDREAAIEAYSKYLRLRSDPEPELMPERDEVRRKLAELVGERGR